MQFNINGPVFVTGADGFIGSHLTEALVKMGCDVTALCLYNSMGNFGWLQQLADKAPSNLKIILGDVRDAGLIESALPEKATIFHLASLIAIPYSYVAPESYFETNVRGALNIAKAALKKSAKRVVHTSTSEVYGTARIVPINEEHPLQGQSPYSASKIAADKLMESYFCSFNLPLVTLRPFNTYGPRQSLRAVIPTILAQAIAGDKKLKLGSISPTRDFNYVTDTVNAFLAVGSTDLSKVLGKTYNAGSGHEISIGDLVTLIGRLFGNAFEIQTEESRIRPGNSEVERLLADSSSLTKATGWESKVSLEEGLLNFAEWLKMNPVKAPHQYQV
jgi:NAD dependent epimerase/dehydratase